MLSISRLLKEEEKRELRYKEMVKNKLDSPVVEGERVVEAVSGAVEEVEGLEADATGDVGHAGSS